MTLHQYAALDALESTDLIGLGMEADAMRRALHPENGVTYLVSGEAAAFCSGEETPDPSASPAGQTPDLQAAAAAVVEHEGCDLLAPASGAVSGLEDALSLLRDLGGVDSRLAIHGFSAADVLRWAQESGAGLNSVLQRLRDAGLRSLGAGGALILSRDRRFDTDLRARASARCAAPDWLAVHRAAHHAGLPSFAAMVMGLGESNQARLDHLQALRQLQAETGGFLAFTLTVHHHASPASRREEEATAVEYLKTLAVARLTLDNIAHIQTDWSVQGPKLLEMALRFGADDAGAIPPPRALGRPARSLKREPSHHSGEAELRRLIRDAGFRPIRRDLLYRRCFLH